MTDIVERLKAASHRLHSSYTKRSDQDCWEWNGAFYKTGYGRFGFNKTSTTAHRAMMMLVLGSEIDSNLEVCHTCDNRKCVNPNHLWLGTTQQNTQDKMKKNRHWVPKGETRSDAKLTDDAVRYIRRSKEPHTEVAKTFGVSEALIRGVRKNVYWKHVQ